MKSNQYQVNINDMKTDWRVHLTEDRNVYRCAMWGSIVTKYGIVRVRTEIRLTTPSLTTFEIVRNGILHLCQITQALDRQHLMDWADRYAQWIGEGSL